MATPKRKRKMVGKRKVLEALLNAKGIPSGIQLKKFNILHKFISSLPINVPLAKQPHELTLSEFKALHYYTIIEKWYPFLLQSREDILKYVPFQRIKDALEDINLELKIRYMKVITTALADRLPGIPLATLEKIQFDTKFFKSVRFYARRFKLDI